MLYKEFTVNGNEYKAVLGAAASVMVEQKLGENPINLIIAMSQDGDKLPSLEKMLVILHASLQKYQHGISMSDVYDIYDSYIEDGHQMADLVALVVEIFEVSGYFKREEENKKGKGKSNSKN